MIIVPGKKNARILVTVLLLAVLVYVLIYLVQALPIISGFGSKVMCSCVYNSNRTPADINKHELASFPFSLANYTINDEDSSATGSIFGLAKRKAIYRRGLGCTLLSEASENYFRNMSSPMSLPAKSNSDTVAWPMGDLNADTNFANVRYPQLSRAVDKIFEEQNEDSLRGTRAVVVVYKGKIILERYAAGFTKDTRQTGWSMTKSITNALVGILVRQGKIKVSAAHLFAPWANDERRNITVDQLLHANSGLEWGEVYSMPSPATNMLFRKREMGDFAASFPLRHEPGTVFEYSSGSSNILSRLISNKIRGDYHGFPFKELFSKTGMYSAVMETDAGGTFVGSSYCFASARDWARFGLLYLNDGVFNGTRILPEGWVQYTKTPSRGANKGEYGAQFWLNAGAPGNLSKRMYPSVPTDCFWADGYQGQFVWIIPSKDLVVVRLGLTKGDAIDENQFLSDVISSFGI